MAAVTVRNLSDETHRALKKRAAEHGRSTESEIRTIPEDAVQPQNELKLGSALAEFGMRWGSVDLDITHDRSAQDRHGRRTGRTSRSDIRQ